MITFSEVSKTFEDGTHALRTLNFTVNKGEFFVLIGPSGCGKTTTMKMINRLIEPTSGSIAISGEPIDTYNVHELRWNIGYVLQEIALFPHMTVAENIAVVPEMKKWDQLKVKERIDHLLDMVGLDPDTFRDRKPDELSGGQQQRVGVVRALAADPDIILMDEPFSALDPISREQLQKDISSLQREIKKTVVFVTHDMDEALALGDRICLMQDGEIVQIDTPQNLVLHPKNEFVKAFIGQRKSPWLTKVDVIMDSDSGSIIDGTVAKEEKGIVFIKEKDDRYVGAFENGKPCNLPILHHEWTLEEAVHRFNNTDSSVLPVVKDEKLIGTLSYKNIVNHLGQEREKERSGNR